MSRKLTKAEIVENAKKTHNDKYDYSLILDDSFKYENAKQKLPIICHEKFEDGTEHGVFEQDYSHHVCCKQPRGCPYCADLARKEHRPHITDDKFISDAKQVHGGTYDYSLVKGCENNHTKVKIICKKHGVFEQDYTHHVVRKHGCQLCGDEKSHFTQRKSPEQFEMESSIIHNGKYKYCGDYEVEGKKVGIICPKHGYFEQIPYVHLAGHGCPLCGSEVSKAEMEIYEFVCGLLGKENVLNRQYGIIDKGELDIYIPSKNIAIEYNGLRWHTEKFGRYKNYHLNKLLKCNEKGIGLIQIFEDEFIKSKELVFSKLKHILSCNYNSKKIYGRNTKIEAITPQMAKDFLNKNHLQGYDRFTVCYGAFYNEKLVGVMSFIQREKDIWELNRFATDNGYVCCGIGSKMFSFFVKNHKPKMVKSFADRRWTVNAENNLYTKLGFKLEKTLRPEYRYFNDRVSKYERFHKFNFRKQILHKKYGFPLSMTESEMTEKLGYYKIWDCGLFKYVWKNPNIETKTETIMAD